MKTSPHADPKYTIATLEARVKELECELKQIWKIHNDLMSEERVKFIAHNQQLVDALEPWAKIAQHHLVEHPRGEYRIDNDPTWDCHTLLVSQMVWEKHKQEKP